MTAPSLNIPAIAELASLGDRFVAWKGIDRNGKIAKVPFRPIKGGALKAESDNPATWGPYTEACDVLEDSDFAGIGFVPRPAEDGIFVIDLDGCINPETGEVADWANELVELVDSYTEISPSGTGLKIFARAGGDHTPRFTQVVMSLDAPRLCDKDPQIEVLLNKYTTLTGDHFGGSPQTIEEAGGFLVNMAGWMADRRANENSAHLKPSVSPWTADLLMRAAEAIPNNGLSWHEWNNNGMRFWAATDGSEDGFAAFDLFSQQCDKYNADDTRQRWREITRSPPTLYNVRSLLIEARKYDKEFFDPESLIAQGVDISKLIEGFEGKPVSSLELVWADDIELNLDESGLVDGFLSTGAMSVMYGDSGSGKTFTAVDIACHVAAGMPWREMRVEQGVVVYIAAESPESVKRRVWAWRQHYGVTTLPLVVVQSHVDLHSPTATTPLLMAEVKRIQATRGPVVMLVVDTLSRAMAGADENSAKDMTAFVGNCDKLRAATTAHVMVVHHSGKDSARGARGHSSLRAATDTEIEVKEGAASVTKQRDLETMGSYGFRLTEVQLGTSRHGRVITTCVAEPAEVYATAAEPQKRGSCKGPNQRIVFEVLNDLLNKSGMRAPGPEPVAGTIVVTREQLRVSAFRTLTQDDPKKKQQAFSRALEGLQEQHLIRCLDDYIWIGMG